MLEDYLELAEIKEEPRFGEITILMNPTNLADRLFRKTKVCASEEEFKLYREHIEERQRINSDHMIYLKHIDYVEEKLTIYVYFEYPEDTLSPDSLKPEEAIHVFGDILEAICYLKDNRIVHGDIRPEYISYFSVENRYKLVDRMADTSQPLKCQLNNIESYKSLYMAPIVFDELCKKSRTIKQNSYKSEVFSIGMVVLGAFKHPEVIQSLYDVDNERFDSEGLAELMAELLGQWTEEPAHSFLEFLRDCVLVVDEKRRMSPTKALTRLQELLRGRAEQVEPGKGAEEPTSGSMKFYNPFDFVKPGVSLVEGIDGRPSIESSTTTIDNEVFQVGESMKIAPIAQEKNLVVMSQRWEKKQIPEEDYEPEPYIDEEPKTEESPEPMVPEAPAPAPVSGHGSGSKPKQNVSESLGPQGFQTPEKLIPDPKTNVSEPQGLLESIGVEHSQLLEGDDHMGRYFLELGIKLDNEEEEDRLEDKIRESEHLSIYREEVLYQNRDCTPRIDKLSDLIRRREDFERDQPSAEETAPRPTATKRAKSIAIMESYSFISPKVEPPQSETESTRSQKKWDMAIQSNYKLLKPSAPLKRSGTEGKLLPPEDNPTTEQRRTPLAATRDNFPRSKSVKTFESDTRNETPRAPLNFLPAPQRSIIPQISPQVDDFIQKSLNRVSEYPPLSDGATSKPLSNYTSNPTPVPTSYPISSPTSYPVSNPTSNRNNSPHLQVLADLKESSRSHPQPQPRLDPFPELPAFVQTHPPQISSNQTISLQRLPPLPLATPGPSGPLGVPSPQVVPGPSGLSGHSEFKPSVTKRVALASTQADSVEQIVQKLSETSSVQQSYQADFIFAETRRAPNLAPEALGHRKRPTESRTPAAPVKAIRSTSQNISTQQTQRSQFNQFTPTTTYAPSTSYTSPTTYTSSSRYTSFTPFESHISQPQPHPQLQSKQLPSSRFVDYYSSAFVNDHLSQRRVSVSEYAPVINPEYPIQRETPPPQDRPFVPYQVYYPRQSPF